MRSLLHSLLFTSLLTSPPALAWNHCPIFEDTTVNWYRTAAVTSHNGKLFFVAEFFNEGASLDSVELRYRSFDGDTSSSGCPSGLGPIYTVLNDAELGPDSIDYSLLTSFSPTDNASTLVLSHKTGDVAAADLRATTFRKSDGVVTEQVLIDRVNLANPSTSDHNHKHSFLIRNPVHDEDHACFTFEDATNNEEAMCAVRDLGDTAWASRWYAVTQQTDGSNHRVHFTECPPDPAAASSTIDPDDTGTVVYNDCLSPTAWRRLEELGSPSENLRHPVVAADPCGNVFVAWMNIEAETIEWRYRCKDGPGPYDWETVATVSNNA